MYEFDCRKCNKTFTEFEVVSESNWEQTYCIIYCPLCNCKEDDINFIRLELF